MRITNNPIHAPLRAALHVADDAVSWYESGPVADLEFSSNVVVRRLAVAESPTHWDTAPVGISPSNTKNATVHRNLRILHNEIHLHRGGTAPVVAVKSTRGVTLADNRIYSPGRQLLPKQMVVQENCSDVVVRDNIVIS